VEVVLVSAMVVSALSFCAQAEKDMTVNAPRRNVNMRLNIKCALLKKYFHKEVKAGHTHTVGHTTF
jgi:hypothetical protein